MKVNDVEIAKALFDPKKVRILNSVENGPKTVKEIAHELNEKPSRLYYHIKKLIDLKLLEVSHTQNLGHISEKYYRHSSYIDNKFSFDGDFAKNNVDLILKQLLTQVNNGIEVLKKDLMESNLEKNSEINVFQIELSKEDWNNLNQEIKNFISKKESEVTTTKEKNTYSFIQMSFLSN